MDQLSKQKYKTMAAKWQRTSKGGIISSSLFFSILMCVKPFAITCTVSNSRGAANSSNKPLIAPMTPDTRTCRCEEN